MLKIANKKERIIITFINDDKLRKGKKAELTKVKENKTKRLFKKCRLKMLSWNKSKGIQKKSILNVLVLGWQKCIVMDESAWKKERKN